MCNVPLCSCFLFKKICFVPVDQLAIFLYKIKLCCMQKSGNLRNFRHPPQCKLVLRPCGMLQRVNPLPTFRDNLSVPSLRFKHSNHLTVKHGTYRLSRNAGNYQHTLRNIPEERRYHQGGCWAVATCVPLMYLTSRILRFVRLHSQ
jgi:hypothetical protein